MTLENKTKKNFKDYKLALLLFLSYFFPSLNIDIGFALKPYMIVTLIVFLSNFSQITFRKLQTNEILMLTFYIYYIFTIVFSDYKDQSLRLVLAVIINIICYFVLRYKMLELSKDSLKNIIYMTGIVYNVLSLILYLIGIIYISGKILPYDVYFGVLNDGNMNRLVGLHMDPNFFALSNFIFFNFFLLNISYKKSKLFFGITLLNMILTISRGGYLVIVVSLLIYIFISFEKAIKNIISLLLIGAFSYGAFYYMFNMDIYALIQSRFGVSSNIDISGGRFSLTNRGLDVFLKNPLLGTGIYTSGFLINKGSTEFQNLHNTYLEVFIESGIIGGALFISFIGTLIYSTFIKFKNRYDLLFLILSTISVIMMIVSLSATTNEFLMLNILIPNIFLIKINESERSFINA